MQKIENPNTVSVEEYTNKDIIDTDKAKPLIIAAPKIDTTSRVNPRISFNTLAKVNSVRSLGVSEDPERFSERLGFADDEPRTNHVIKAPGTDFYVPDRFHQFMPEIKRIIEDYYAQPYAVDGYCTLAISQNVVLPAKDNNKQFIKPHNDINLFQLQETGETDNWHNYVVSDCLMTGISDRALTEDEIEKIKSADNPVDAHHSILNQEDVAFKHGKPYEILTFDSTVPHSIQNPIFPTRRTFVTLGFSGSDAEYLRDGFNNPWLEKVFDERKVDAETDRTINSPALPSPSPPVA